MRNQNLKGFTLIELLIVIAIIGILAAVLIPNLLQARARANDTVARTYLSDAVRFQEINQIDNRVYTTDEAVLQAVGLKVIPENDPLTFEIIGADAATYCMSATHSGGTAGTVFYATPATSITTTECTAPAPE